MPRVASLHRRCRRFVCVVGSLAAPRTTDAMGKAKKARIKLHATAASASSRKSESNPFPTKGTLSAKERRRERFNLAFHGVLELAFFIFVGFFRRRLEIPGCIDGVWVQSIISPASVGLGRCPAGWRVIGRSVVRACFRGPRLARAPSSGSSVPAAAA